MREERAHLVGRRDDLLAQRLRCPTDVRAVRACISQALEADLDDERTWASVRDVCMQQNVAPTAAMARLVQLMGAALDHEEPVLLVGETGGGKTTACQLLAAMRGQPLRVLNCHLHSEASDFLGALRPARRESGGALFEWVDGCLVEAMRRGEMVLLDELNLADDAVLERLALLWDSTEVVFDTLLQKSEHIEKFLEFAREPQLLGRFRQRLAEYKRFWVDVQAVSRATLQNSPRGAAVE